MPRTYSVLQKDLGTSPDVWVITKSVEGEQQLITEVLRLLDNVDAKVSIALVRNT
jgi:hypothetical protein